ncbi:hypothetical protein DL96DRAFT_950624 [Flagelloscypha sp. PMI_526]|nr:hypothetical protein DL96DRAFT_950624 [Flagelloscypha sp. PMI_526]
MAISDLLQKCTIPSEYSFIRNIDRDNDQATAILSKLAEFPSIAHLALTQILQLCQDESEVLIPADVVFTVSAFYGDDDSWTTPECQATANSILALFIPLQNDVVRDILEGKIKPLFQRNLHPYLNATTGRKLSHPAGGREAMFDYQEEQTWKEHPGVLNTLSWLVQYLEPHLYEKCWHLLIPPIMTLLDDFDTTYKTRGAETVEKVLANVPRILLQQTGVHMLLSSSLKTCLAFIETDSSPRLLRSSIRAQVALNGLMHSSQSRAYFDKTCELLGDGIIGSVWTYAYNKPQALLATFDVLPLVVEHLGIGCIRFMKVIVQQLVQPLVISVSTPKTMALNKSLQKSSLRALRCVMLQMSPRIQRWKYTILDGICRCWILEQEISPDEELQNELQNTIDLLIRLCPSTFEQECRQIVVLDERFQALFRQSVTV